MVAAVLLGPLRGEDDQVVGGGGEAHQADTYRVGERAETSLTSYAGARGTLTPTQALERIDAREAG
ncbi:hypothetical protein GCM10010336_41040 [Streptomyces goshikiensis]|nr:hypothetical protein GCM10010336_41040 [Streptomyces goshikiensis]